MSILIRGMEMPFTCWACEFSHIVNCAQWKNHAEEIVLDKGTKRHPDCPLIPVPPHGRMGDLDALIDKVIAKYLEHERKGELVFAAAEIKQDIVDLISDAPTIIPAEEG